VRATSAENVLPQILTRWFGPTAGQPGTTQFVRFRRVDGSYVLEPIRESAAPSGPELWRSYSRNEIAARLGVKLVGWDAQTGVVVRPKLMLLFVTLDKSRMAEEHRYEDQFVSASEFQWQSQNQTSQSSSRGQDLVNHVARGIRIHLCVRHHAKAPNGATMPFVYCGELEFERWEGEKPITVWWKLRRPVPAELHRELGLVR
jgi:hypothetical protein